MRGERAAGGARKGRDPLRAAPRPSRTATRAATRALSRAAGLLLALAAAGCALPEEDPGSSAAATPEPHCWRCDRTWSEQALAEHERHRTELGLGMYATGCEFCRYHGAYKDR